MTVARVKKRAENLFSLAESFSRLIVLNYSAIKRKEKTSTFYYVYFPFPPGKF
jgi:hypothetical protein